MVQVGYNYYSQCYDLKKKKQEELYPTKGADQLGKRITPTVDASMVNVKNAEIYLGVSESNGVKKRGLGSKRRKLRTLNKAPSSKSN